MSLSFGSPPAPRRPNLTPMIDVVFLLLVFFMLASRFGTESAVSLTVAGQGGGYSGPPRLVTVYPDRLTLNGVALDPDVLATELDRMTETPGDIIVLRPAEDAPLQRIVEMLDLMGAAGFSRVVLVE
ncbi:biopolymer transporter ExbD [Puniceibacterium sp. IMCC21224]|uniref:ExbD/TolR family protein n=1 Tax=Puniceibacterium sp. IMCC21224 TaxID=1618204 RepID=UPI00064D7D9B|nr:biopolymer transporter ExbD [Puniceibacterium sp. IMCC21224]KMK67006.1 biopolymer transport protein [Puniceibacterium sp. IMCC21224]